MLIGSILIHIFNHITNFCKIIRNFLNNNFIFIHKIIFDMMLTCCKKFSTGRKYWSWLQIRMRINIFIKHRRVWWQNDIVMSIGCSRRKKLLVLKFLRILILSKFMRGIPKGFIVPFYFRIVVVDLARISWF